MILFTLFSLPKEIEKLSLELSESKQRLEQQQEKATRAREECLKLTELLGESMGFPRQEYWSGVPFPSLGDLPDPGIEPMSSALAGGFFTAPAAITKHCGLGDLNTRNVFLTEAGKSTINEPTDSVLGEGPCPDL